MVDRYRFFLSINLSIYLSICLSVYLSIYLPIDQSRDMLLENVCTWRPPMSSLKMHFVIYTYKSIYKKTVCIHIYIYAIIYIYIYTIIYIYIYMHTNTLHNQVVLTLFPHPLEHPPKQQPLVFRALSYDLGLRSDVGMVQNLP